MGVTPERSYTRAQEVTNRNRLGGGDHGDHMGCDVFFTCASAADLLCCAGFTGVACGRSCCDSMIQKCVAGSCSPTGSACGSVCCAGGLICTDPKSGSCALPPSSCTPGQSNCLSVQLLSPLPDAIEIAASSVKIPLAATASPVQPRSYVSRSKPMQTIRWSTPSTPF